METITNYMSIDHKHCDDIFAALERNVSDRRWPAAESAMKEFATEMELHLAMEEDVLFPAFEAATGSSNGPTRVMRSEHAEIRDIIQQLQQVLEAKDNETFLGLADTLNILLQQHNMKEEGILYPMADRVLSASRDEILNAMSNLAVPA